jgi:hypothetical protein
MWLTIFAVTVQLFKKQLFDLEVKGQGPTKTYLERQKSYGQDKLR